MKKWLTINVVILLVLTAFLLTFIIFTYKDHGATFDEFDQIKYGQGVLNYYLSFFTYRDFFKLFPAFFYPTHGIFPVALTELFVRISNNLKIETYHFWNAVFSIPAYIFVYLSVHKITGSKITAIFSFLSLITFPRFTGDIFNNSKDIPLGVYFSISIYLTLFLQESGFKNRKYFILLGLILGIMMSIKIISVYVVILVLILCFKVLSRSYGGSLPPLSRPSSSIVGIFVNNYNKYKAIPKKEVIIFLLSAYFSLILFSPHLHVSPIFGLLKSVKDSFSYQDVGQTLFDGNVFMSNNLPFYYLPKLLLITIPEFTILFFSYGIYSICRSKVFYKGDNKVKRLQILENTKVILILLMIPVLGTVMFRPSIYDMWRHFLFLAIPIVIISSVGFYLLLKDAYKFKYLTVILGFIGIFSIIIKMINLHPYEYTYFNAISGGLANAQSKYETEYWGKSFRFGAQWINGNYDKLGALPVLSCVPTLSSPYLNGNIKIAVDDKVRPFIYLCFTRLNKNNFFDGNVVYQIIRDGAVLNEVRIVN